MADEPKTYTQDEVNELTKQLDAVKGNRDAVLDEKRKLADRLKAVPEDFDPTEWKTLREEREQRAREKATAEGDFKKLETQLVERHSAEMSAKEKAIAKRNAVLEQKLVKSELMSALVAAGVEDESLELMVTYALKSGAMRETDDGFEGYVVGADGKTPRIQDGKGTPMTFADLAHELAEKFPRSFKGTGSTGGGASKSNAGGGGSKFIAAGDDAAFLANLEGIAKGQTVVR